MALSEVRVPPFYRGNWQGDLYNVYQKKLDGKGLSENWVNNTVSVSLWFFDGCTIDALWHLKGGMHYWHCRIKTKGWQWATCPNMGKYIIHGSCLNIIIFLNHLCFSRNESIWAEVGKVSKWHCDTLEGSSWGMGEYRETGNGTSCVAIIGMHCVYITSKISWHKILFKLAGARKKTVTHFLLIYYGTWSYHFVRHSASPSKSFQLHHKFWMQILFGTIWEELGRCPWRPTFPMKAYILLFLLPQAPSNLAISTPPSLFFSQEDGKTAHPIGFLWGFLRALSLRWLSRPLCEVLNPNARQWQSPRPSNHSPCHVEVDLPCLRSVPSQSLHVQAWPHGAKGWGPHRHSDSSQSLFSSWDSLDNPQLCRGDHLAISIEIAADLLEHNQIPSFVVFWSVDTASHAFDLTLPV